MSDLQKIQKEIEKKLGLSVYFYAENTRPQGVVVCETPFESVTDDGERTYFRFLHKRVGYVGVLDGVGEEMNKYALLLPSYIESFIEREEELPKGEHLKKILLGESTSMSVYKYAMKYSVREKSCFAIALRVEKYLEEALTLLEQYVGNSLDVALQMNENTCVLVRFAGEEMEEYHSSVDYAEFLVQLLKEELGVDALAGVGPMVRELKDVSVSYAGAENALRYADVFDVQGSVHSYREFILVQMLESIPEARLEEFLSELSGARAKEVFGDEEMLSTAECFLQNSLNVSEASRKLYMHRNTLLYRLDKIERETGLNIRSFSDAVSFRVLTILHRLLNK